MSIKKALMHYFDKATNGMISFHPETESACVTDWHSGIMNSLASTTLGTVVSALTTDSVAGKLLKLLLTASGVRYSIDTNGYVCLGSFFGGLIIQWIYVNTVKAPYRTISFPIAFPNGVFVCTANLCGNAADTTEASVIWNDGQTTRSMVQFRINGTASGAPKCIAIGH